MAGESNEKPAFSNDGLSRSFTVWAAAVAVVGAGGGYYLGTMSDRIGLVEANVSEHIRLHNQEGLAYERRITALETSQEFLFDRYDELSGARRYRGEPAQTPTVAKEDSK